MTKIKFFKTSPTYPEALDYIFSSRNINMADLTYQELYHQFMKDAFGWSDFWKVNLEKLGNYEVEEVIHSAEIMQKKWAMENKVFYSEQNWVFDIVFAQIAAYQPEVVFLHDYSFTPAFREKIRKEVPSVKIILAWDGILFHNEKQFAGADIVLAHVKDTRDYYKNYGFRTVEFSHGFEESILEKLSPITKNIPISFVGSIMLFAGGHIERLHFLADLSRKIDINLFLSGSQITNEYGLFNKNQIARLKAMNFRDYFDIWQLGRTNRGEKFGVDMFQTFADSQITINKHIDLAKNNAANMRLFESTGVGTCLLTDWKDNLSEYFVPDEEVITFKTTSEAVSKIKYLLTHETERQKIAKAGQKKTLQKFNFKNNFERLDLLIQSML